MKGLMKAYPQTQFVDPLQLYNLLWSLLVSHRGRLNPQETMGPRRVNTPGLQVMCQLALCLGRRDGKRQGSTILEQIVGYPSQGRDGNIVFPTTPVQQNALSLATLMSSWAPSLNGTIGLDQQSQSCRIWDEHLHRPALMQSVPVNGSSIAAVK